MSNQTQFVKACMERLVPELTGLTITGGVVDDIEATAKRMEAHLVVLAAQNATSLSYNTHSATEGLGPISPHADGAQGLKLHDTIAFAPEGVPLGVIDVDSKETARFETYESMFKLSKFMSKETIFIASPASD